MKTILGKDLKVGDVIELFGRKVRVIKLTPYKGPLTKYLGDDARIAKFDVGGPGMTVDAAMSLRRVEFEGGV